MAGNGSKSSKKQQAMETSKSIAEQTEAYIASGGKVEKIANGISAYTFPATKKTSEKSA